MQNTVALFQAELMQKIQFKTFSNVSLDAYLFKNFKFYDLHSQGYLSKADFFRAIAKCGVVVETHDVNTVYNAYASEDGNVYYKQFIQNFLFKEPTPPSQSRVNNQPEPERKLEQSKRNTQEKQRPLEQSRIDKLYKCETYAEVLGYIKKSLGGEGLGSILGLAVKLKAADSQRKHLLNKNTISSLAPFLQPDHVNLIFGQLSQNGKQIDYSILVYDLKGEPQQSRIRQIENTFQLLDQRREGEFPINYLLSRYLSKREAPNFSKAINLYCSFQGIDDGVFTQDDFLDCFGFLSVDCPSDDLFYRLLIKPFTQQDTVSMMSQQSNRSRDFRSSQVQQKNFKKNKEQPLEEKVFNQEQNFNQFPEEKHNFDKKSVSKRSQAKEVPANQMKQVESIIMRMKKRLASKGTKGFLFFQKSMKGADADRDGLLTFDQFRGVIKEQRIDITPTECDHIFKVFDEQGAQLINYSQIMFALRGNIPQSRRPLVEKLCEQVCRDGSSSFSLLKKRLNFRNHPDVQNGRRYEEDIWKEVQETILTIQQLNGTTRKDTITKQEFEEYVEHLNLSIIDDKLFETILSHFWRLQSSDNITDKYAGSRKLFDPTKKGYLMDHHRYAVKGGSVSQNAPFGTSVQPTTYTTQHRRL